MATTHTVEVGYDEFCGALQAKDLQPLWTQNTKLMPKQPHPRTLPWLWKWTTILPLAERAVDLITLDKGGDRRVLALANPGLGGMPYTSTTLWGAVQYLGPHESAPAHRHSPAAIRFVMEGEGVWTTVDGDACDMRPGDLILTPKGAWHDHTNAGDAPMAWFDGLDLPLVGYMEAVFFERYPGTLQPIEGRNLSEQRHGGAGLLPAGPAPTTPRRSPLLRYAWDETDRALTTLLRQRGGKMASIRYADPLTGASALPTLGCEMHRLLPGERTAPLRKVGSSIYVVLHGAGRTVIDGQRFDWTKGDIFVAPSWSVVDHEALEPADLFSISDRPILEALDLYKEESTGSAQDVTGVFEPK